MLPLLHTSYARPTVPETLLNAVETGIAYLTPVYSQDGLQRPPALAFDSLSLVAQQLLGLPEFPIGTLDALLPQATGFADFCCATLLSGEIGHYTLPPSPTRRGRSWRVAAQRQGEQLVAVVTAVEAPPAAPVPLPPSESAWAQMPVAICILRGSTHRHSYFNPAYERLLPGRVIADQPLAELLPPSVARELLPIVDYVYTTGDTYTGFERALTLGPPNEPVTTTYLNLTIQPYQENGQLVGVSFFGYDVTQQVEARRQTHKQKLNKKLRASNAELRANNQDLTNSQQLAQQFNQELEARVAAGIAEAQRARAEADCQRQRLERLFRQSPAAISILSGPELVYEFVNSRYQQLFPGRQLLGLSLREARTDLNDQANPDQLRAVYETGITHEGRERLLRVPRPKDGQLEDRYFDCLYQPRYDGQNRIDGVLIFALEVTEQVLMRRQMQQLNEELESRVAARTQEAHTARATAEAKHQQLYSIIEHAPASMAYISGPELRFVTINQAACQVWGMPQAELVGRPLLEALPQVRGLAIQEQLLSVMRTQVAYHGQSIRMPLWRGGKLVAGYFNYVLQPIIMEPAGAVDVLIVAIEVTQQVRDHQRIQQFNRELTVRVAAGIAEAEQVRAEAEQARAEAEHERQRLENFFKQAPAAICVLGGPELVYELVNPAYQQRFPGRQLLGLALLDAVPEFTGHAVVARMRDAYATGITNTGSEVLLRVARPDDSRVEDAYFDCVYQARFNEQGIVDGVLVFALDVTAKVKAQRRSTALQAQLLQAAQRQTQAQATFLQVFDQTSAAIAFLRGPDLRFEYVNQAYEQLFPGIGQVGVPLAETLRGTRPQGFLAIIAQVYQTGKPYVGNEVPVEINQATGPPLIRYLNFTYQAFREEKIIVGLSVFAYDVTEQVLARQQREVGLAQLQIIFEQAPMALALLDGPTYTIRVANPALLAFWQQSPEEVLNKPFFEVQPRAVDLNLPELLAQVRRTGQPYAIEEQLVKFERDWGTESFYFHYVLQPMFEAHGQVVTSIMLIANEITQQVHSRRQLAEANDALRATNIQLTRTNTDLDNFIYTASHDLKAPISNIESLLIMLRKQLPREARQAGLVPKVLHMMQEAIGRFQLTIAQLTDLSRLQQAHTELTEAVDLQATMEAVRLDLATELETTGARLTVDVEHCATVLLPPHHLRSVIYNLLSNALKYHRPNQAPDVSVRCYQHAGMSVLSVQDNGLGLSSVQQQKIFGLFRRLHAHVEGSGVGLYMVKRIVENAGGTIAVQSKPGIGSTFIVSLPVATPSSLA